MEHRIRSRFLRTALLVALLLGGSASSTPVIAQLTESPYYDLVIDEARGRLYASNQFTGNLDVISIFTLEVIDRVILGSQPSGMDLSPDGNELAVALRGQGEVALVDIENLAVIHRLVPTVKFGPNLPVEVEYGRPGRLYTVGNPGHQGIDYLHVFDTNSNVEIARSGEAIRYKPYLAITADGNKIYIGESETYPQQLYRFDISSDQPVLDALAPEWVDIAESLCVTSQGKVVTAGGQIWLSDLSLYIPGSQDATIPNGTYVECDPINPRAIYTGLDRRTGQTGISMIDTSTPKTMLSMFFSGLSGPGRLNTAGDTLYVATVHGIQALHLDRLSITFLPQVGDRYCTGFSDTFDNPASGWRAMEDEHARSEYSNGEFRIQSKDDQVIHLFRAPACINYLYKIEVSARWINHPGDSYGLIFDIAGDFERYSLLQINSSNGTYRLIRVNQNSNEEIVPSTKNPAIHTGMQLNRLTIYNTGWINLQINSTPVAVIEYPYSIDPSWVGVFSTGRSNTQAGFDDFLVTNSFPPPTYPNPYP